MATYRLLLNNVAMMDAEDLSDQPRHAGGPAAHIPDPEPCLLAMPLSKTSKSPPRLLLWRKSRPWPMPQLQKKEVASEKNNAHQRAKYITCSKENQ